MGIQTMNSHGGGCGQQSQGHSPLARQNSWFSLTLDEVENQLGDLGKPLGSMNLDELLKNVWTAEASHSSWMDPNNASPASSLQLQASLSLARVFNGKTVDEVWKDIQGHKLRNEEETSSKEREPTLGETTLEDFLVKAGLYVADASLGPVTGLQNALTTQSFTPPMGLSPSPSLDALSDMSIPRRKRHSGDPQKNLDRRLKRKIKNRESAARSRARKQAYHNELVSRVSLLEEANAKLRKEKEFEKMLISDFAEPRYQLRRTSSTVRCSSIRESTDTRSSIVDCGKHDLQFLYPVTNFDAPHKRPVISTL
ncbi:ABSCISIC ACID-INSENSITIVE 5-like protein 2 [Forsythia ovata]|uniref:ABSCISIC ACID-INSENSITIVE 5-like protein 2 n=1 Tax=Forsythia ovata TaxID=205694 RepID=A0ABD1X5N9_9LAMI